MERNMFARFANDLKRLGARGVGAPEFSLGRNGKYDLQYIPFEHVNRDARLVIVGITPGNTQLELAYGKAQELLNAGRPEEDILIEVKKAGAFGGKSMKPNLLKMLRHFRFEKLLGIEDVDTLWGDNANLLHSTSVVPHAAFVARERFNGSFDEIQDSPLLKQCFLDCFAPSIREVSRDALFVALGPCPQAALEWCVIEGAIRREQVLGSFCHPSSAGGSTTKYYLREISKDELNLRNPVRSRCDWLDQAYEEMRATTAFLHGEDYQPPVVTKETAPPTATNPTSVTTSRKRKADEAISRKSSTPATADTTTILEKVERAGYKPTKTTAKLSEFESPGGQTIYVVKTTSKLNNINLIVHPSYKPEVLRKIDGVGSVSKKHRFHSNMTSFPKRINNGKTETAFGWQINIETLTDLPRFLVAFKSVVF
jgi:hypothetical protein